MCVAPPGGLLFSRKTHDHSLEVRFLFPSEWLHFGRLLHRLHRLLLYKFDKFNNPKWGNKISRKPRTCGSISAVYWGCLYLFSSCLALYGQLGVFFVWSLPNLLFGEVGYFSWPSGWAHMLNLF